MDARRFNADTPLGPQVRREVEQLKRMSPEARAVFDRVRDQQLADHAPLAGTVHTPAQQANATQMGNKAVAMAFLRWPQEGGGRS
jgi:hypothetical protein